MAKESARTEKRPLLIWLLLLAVAAGIGIYVWFSSPPTESASYASPCDPDIPFTTLTDDDWGYSVSHPETWYMQTYEPGENVASSAGPEDADPEELSYFMGALATEAGNFSPQYTQDGELIRLFLGRDPFIPDFSLEEYLDQIRGDEDLGIVDGRHIRIDGSAGSSVTMINENLNTRFVYLDAPPFTYSLKFEIFAGPHQEQCIAVSHRIQDSFRLSSKDMGIR